MDILQSLSAFLTVFTSALQLGTKPDGFGLYLPVFFPSQFSYKYNREMNRKAFSM